MASSPRSPSSGNSGRKRDRCDHDDEDDNAYRSCTRGPPMRGRYSSPNNRLYEYRNPLPGHRGFIQHASFSRTGNFLATSSQDNTAKIWESSGPPHEPLRCVHTLRHPQRVYGCFVSNDGSRAVSNCGDGAIRVWSRANRYEDSDFMTIRDKNYSFARACQISGDGQFVVASFYRGNRTPIRGSSFQFMSAFRSSVIMKHTGTRQVIFDISISGKVDVCRMSSCATVIALGRSSVNPAEALARGCSISIVGRDGNCCHTFHDVLPNNNVCLKWDLSPPGDRVAIVSPEQDAIVVYQRDNHLGWRNAPVFLSAHDSGPYSHCTFAENGKYLMAMVGGNRQEWKAMRIFSLRKRTLLYDISHLLRNCYVLCVEPAMLFTQDSNGQYEQIRMICKDWGDNNGQSLRMVTSKYSVEPSTNISSLVRQGGGQREHTPRRNWLNSDEGSRVSRFSNLNRENLDHPSQQNFRSTEAGLQPDDNRAMPSYLRAGDMGTVKDSRSLFRDPRVRAKDALGKMSPGNYNRITAFEREKSPIATVGNASSLGSSAHTNRHLRNEPEISPQLKRQKRLPFEAQSYQLEKYQREHGAQWNSDRSDTSNQPNSEVTVGVAANDFANLETGTLSRRKDAPSTTVEPTSGQEPANGGPACHYEPLEDGELPPSPPPIRSCPENPANRLVSKMGTRCTEGIPSIPQRGPQGIIHGKGSIQLQNQNTCPVTNSGGPANLDAGETGPMHTRTVADDNNLEHGGSKEQEGERQEPRKLSSVSNGKEGENSRSSKGSTGTLKGHPSADRTASNLASNLDSSLVPQAMFQVRGNPDLLVHMPPPNNNSPVSKDALPAKGGSDYDIATARTPRLAARQGVKHTGDVENAVSFSERSGGKSPKKAGSATCTGQTEIQMYPEKNVQSVDDSRNSVRRESVAENCISPLESAGVDCALVSTKKSTPTKAGAGSDSNPLGGLATQPSGKAMCSGTNESSTGCNETGRSSMAASTCIATGKNHRSKNERIITLQGASSSGSARVASPSHILTDVDMGVNDKSIAPCSQGQRSRETSDGEESGFGMPVNADGVLFKARRKNNEKARDAKPTRVIKSEDLVSMLQRKARVAFHGAAERVTTDGKQYISGAQAYTIIRDMLKTSSAWVNDKEIASVVYGKTGTENICYEAMFVQAFGELCSEAQSRRRPLLEKTFADALTEGEETLLAFHAGELLRRAIDQSNEPRYAQWGQQDLVDVFVTEGGGMLINLEVFITGSEKVICGSVGAYADKAVILV
eukprot:GFKZ01004874.1.p1 GENE.GFKZ01004874.1~~GFKZ01004874.1.p1  ORF type:complete len:1340 (+),score=146.02 GFKZ01004874.1:230-4021(+)